MPISQHSCCELTWIACEPSAQGTGSSQQGRLLSCLPPSCALLFPPAASPAFPSHTSFFPSWAHAPRLLLCSALCGLTLETQVSEPQACLQGLPLLFGGGMRCRTGQLRHRLSFKGRCVWSWRWQGRCRPPKKALYPA